MNGFSFSLHGLHREKRDNPSREEIGGGVRVERARGAIVGGEEKLLVGLWQERL